MIFVTIGQMYGFERLIIKMDEIAGRIDEQTIMQIGNTVYEPKNAEYFRFLTKKEMDKYYENARLVISHAGVGSILSSLNYGKPIILVPRMKKYAEAVDDHQLQIAGEFEKEGVAIVVYKIGDLEKTIAHLATNNSGFQLQNTLAKRLKEYLSQLEKGS